MTTARTRLAALSVLLATALLLLAPALIGTPASADPPTQLPARVVDAAEVLDQSAEKRVDTAVNQLSSEKDLQLWVVYVKSFNGKSPKDWAHNTIALNDLSYHDVLLAIATDDRTFYLTTAEQIDGIDRSDLDRIGNQTVKPALQNSDWANAAVTTADDLESLHTGSHTALIVTIIVIVLLVVAGIVFYLRRRGKPAEPATPGSGDQDDLTVDQLGQQPLEVLDPWSREVLTSTDNAVSASADELALAADELGGDDAAPFRDALRTAESALATSFKLRQRVDDGLVSGDDERRAMLVQIIAMCSDADDALDAQVTQFDAQRDLLSDAPARLTALGERLTAVSARFADAQTRLDALTARYGGAVVGSIAPNVDLAREQARFAEDSIDQGREAVAAPAGERGPAVAAVRSAESSLDVATKLLDAVDDAEQNLVRAQNALPDFLADVARDLDSDEVHPTAAEVVRTALDNARAVAGTDPLSAFALLTDADHELLGTGDDAGAGTADGSGSASPTTTTRRARLVERTLESAAARVGAAESFVDTRRGAVQSTARTRLSEAERLLDKAQKAAPHDGDASLDVARRAGLLADEALAEAQRDVAGWEADPSTTRDADGTSAAVLTGVLVDSFLLGSMRDDKWAGGYSRGGRSPGSFGGSESVGRIGTGGRI
ncbi:MAG: TPM domain-containing protein [Gordonia sp. (in: high G+C Gram-positive bacteria)]